MSASRTPLEIRYRATKKIYAPEFHSSGAAGADLRAALDHPLPIEPGQYQSIPTGLTCAIPEGFEGQVRPRSGLAKNHGVTVLNAPGTIDSDYRGEIEVLLINHGAERYTVMPRERIAQLVVGSVTLARYVPQETLDTTERGANGFGSTGQ